MKFKNVILSMAAMSILAVTVSCDDDDPVNPEPGALKPEAGTITGGPFTFNVDGEVDNVSGIGFDNSVERIGEKFNWVITDAVGNILGTPPTMEALEDVNFDGAGVGTCLIWYLRFNGELENASEGDNANDIVGDFDLSNSLEVRRLGKDGTPNGGTITGGPFNFTVDGEVDNVSGIDFDDSDERIGNNASWVITDESNMILGTPPSIQALNKVNFDGAGVGKCFVWYLRYNGELTNFESGKNVSDIEGEFNLSNSIEVDRNSAVAGTISGGPFNFVIDGQADIIGENKITLDSSNSVGENNSWVITDNEGNILGLPKTLADVEANDFDPAGVGTCLIWYARWNGEITGAEKGKNANDIEGDFALSNSLTVNRTAAN